MNRKEQGIRSKEEGTRGYPYSLLLIPCSLLLSVSLLAEEPPPARIFWSDAKVSFTIPDGWAPGDEFPEGPLFIKKTAEGTDAFILGQASAPRDPDRISSDVDPKVLGSFALENIQSAGGRVLAHNARTLLGKNAYEITWEQKNETSHTQTQSVFFFLENRFLAVALQAQRDSFAWLVPEFQEWLKGLRLLSRTSSGELDAPARGGRWIHETGGARVWIPEHWLIGVADDRMMGATFAENDRFITLTITVEPSEGVDTRLSEKTLALARKAIRTKGFKITEEMNEPFHGLPSLQFSYEGSPKGRFVKGHDLWVLSAKGRWLINLEGDSKLFRDRREDFRDILNALNFL